MEERLSTRKAIEILLSGKKICEESSWTRGARFKYLYMDSMGKIIAGTSSGEVPHRFDSSMDYIIYNEGDL